MEGKGCQSVLCGALLQVRDWLNKMWEMRVCGEEGKGCQCVWSRAGAKWRDWL